MAPFIKTLFGDARNVMIVAVLLALEFTLIRSGLRTAATLLVPIGTLAGIAWPARASGPRPKARGPRNGENSPATAPEDEAESWLRRSAEPDWPEHLSIGSAASGTELMRVWHHRVKTRHGSGGHGGTL